MVFNTTFIIFAEEIESQAIGVWFEYIQQPCAQCSPLRGIDVTFEDGILHPDAIVQTGFSDMAQAPATRSVNRTDIIAYQEDVYKRQTYYASLFQCLFL